MEETSLIPFYKKIKETEKECGHPIQSLHVDVIIEIFEKTSLKDFQMFYKDKNVNEIIQSLLFIKDKWLGEHLVCQLMIMMDEWEKVDEFFEHETLKKYY